jgi:hypothetical protein
MALLLITLGTAFLAGIAVGVFALLVIGIQLDTRRMSKVGTADTRLGTPSRRLLTTGLGRNESRR